MKTGGFEEHAVLGVSASFLHKFVFEGIWVSAQRRLSAWSAQEAFTNPNTGQLEAAPNFTPGQGWSARARVRPGPRALFERGDDSTARTCRACGPPEKPGGVHARIAFVRSAQNRGLT